MTTKATLIKEDYKEVVSDSEADFLISNDTPDTLFVFFGDTKPASNDKTAHPVAPGGVMFRLVTGKVFVWSPEEYDIPVSISA